MKSFRIALAQVNPVVGALRANGDKLLEWAHRAAEAGAAWVVFPEMALSGYPPEDLVFKPHFLDDCREEAHRVAAGLPDGRLALFGAPWRERRGVCNAALVCGRGRLLGVYAKMELPNYGVFDEKRLFRPGAKPGLLRMEDSGVRVALQVCEDSWRSGSPALRRLARARPHLVVNLSASPYHAGKLAEREAMLAAASGRLGAPMVYCNLVGGQDELVFDGGSMVVGPGGEVLARARRFEEDLLMVDLPVEGGGEGDLAGLGIVDVPEAPGATDPPARSRLEPAMESSAEIYGALTLGVRDYVGKNGFRRAVVALSGGIDSALVAAVAVDALGADRVVGVTMPSRYSSDDTRGDAERLAVALGIEFHELPIEPLFDATLRELAPVWAGHTPGLAEENLQARLRGVLLMALSNAFGWLVLATGNKSELATGYCTLYGDMVGGFAPIKDVFKTRVFELCRWRNARDVAPVIPVSILERPPSAELRDNQKDSDSLPPYDWLDPVLERAVEQDRSIGQILAEGFDAGRVRDVFRMLDAAEYKRRQAAPGIKITPRAFGRDRRVPMTNLYREHA